MNDEIEKDILYSKIIRICNNSETLRNQTIENKNMNLITTAGIFISTVGIILGFIVDLVEIPTFLKIMLLINLLIFISSIFLNYWSFMVRKFETLDFKGIMALDDQNVASIRRSYVGAELKVYENNKKIVESKLSIFRINFIIVLIGILHFIINIVLLLVTSTF